MTIAIEYAIISSRCRIIYAYIYGTSKSYERTIWTIKIGKFNFLSLSSLSNWQGEWTCTISTIKYTVRNVIFLRGIISRWHFSHVPHINRVLSTARCIYYNTRKKTNVRGRRWACVRRARRAGAIYINNYIIII